MIDGRCEVFIQGSDLDQLRAATRQLLQSGARSLMILACADDDWVHSQLQTFLGSLPVPVFGGVFPSIIYQAQRHARGTLVLGLHEDLVVHTITRISDKAGALGQLEALSDSLKLARSLICLVDGLSTNLEAFVESLYEQVGASMPVTGGGAGYLDFVQRPCLFSNQGLIADAALLIAKPTAFYLGIAHGWQRLEGPFLVTKSRANVLEELDYRPAFEVYREAVLAHAEVDFETTDFFSTSKTYPLGIESVDETFLVRDPIKRSENRLICVGEVPQNATIYLLKGEAATLISSAGDAAAMALAKRQTTQSAADPSAALVFDCISRVLFLDDSFAAELTAVKDALPGVDHIVGALTLGEIASSEYGLIELLNKSTVVTVF